MTELKGNEKDNVYVDTTKPAFFFGKGLTRVTVWKQDRLVWPEASGAASAKLHEACAELGGRAMTFKEVFDALKQLL